MIEFKRQYTMKNGNKVTKSNWHKVIAICEEPCTTILGVTEIEKAKKEKGSYYCTYNLKKEDKGYIFREQYADTGINGHHKTFKEAIWHAMSHRIKVMLTE